MCVCVCVCVCVRVCVCAVTSISVVRDHISTGSYVLCDTHIYITCKDIHINKPARTDRQLSSAHNECAVTSSQSSDKLTL